MFSKPKNKGKLYFRLATIFFLVMIFSSGILFGGTFITLYRSLRSEDAGYMQRRLLSYWAHYQTAGLDGLMDGLEAESLILDERPYFVRVATAENSTVFLSYPEHWEPFMIHEVLEKQELSDFDELLRIRSDSMDFELEVNTILLDQEYLVQVGMSTERRQTFLGLYRRNFILFLSLVLIFGLAAGLFLASRAIAPVKRLSTALGSIIRTGDLSARLPQRKGRGRPDEMDELVSLFNRLLERIEGLIGRMRETLDTVAHDLRTPLTRLRSGAELALQSGNLSQKNEALSDALEESERILTLLSAVMDISEAESGILKLNRQNINPRETLEKLTEIYQFIASELDISINLKGKFPSMLSVDPARFNQAAGNLLDNAVKYSPSGGRITVLGSVHQDQEKPVFRVTVENQGPPIPKEELGRIWERLYRAQGNTVPGMGLGLSLVKAVVEAHGGLITAENIGGRGNEGGVRFTMEFLL
jgi:signal transduction histidine kinase